MKNIEDYEKERTAIGFRAWILNLAILFGLICADAEWLRLVKNYSSGADDLGEEGPYTLVPNFIAVISKFDLVNCLVLILAFLVSSFILGRLHFLATRYSKSNSQALFFAALSYLAILPLTMLIHPLLGTIAGGGGETIQLLQDLARNFSETMGQLTLASAGFGTFLSFLIGVLLVSKFFLFPAPYLRKSDQGIILGVNPWRELWGAKLIPWARIDHVGLYRDKKTGDSLFIRSGKSAYKIAWNRILDINPVSLMNELRNNCAGAIDNSIYLREELQHDENTYTELWLKYFSASTERNRTGMLCASDSLCDGKYQIAGQLGGGGQGTAYLASHSDNGNELTVVLKEYILPIHRGDSIFQESLKKLEHEAEILEKINHPNIVRLLDTFVEDHRGYLVLEYVDGPSLKQLVEREGPQPESVVIDWALQICDILSHLHEMDPPIIHRDLTPDNLLLSSDGRVKLVDFNVAHKLESSANATIVGKHAYLPPEQFRGKPCTQSDLYAFGGTIFYLLTGKEPAPLSSSHPRIHLESLSPELDLIVSQATALDLSKRSVSSSQIKDSLSQLAAKVQAKTAKTSGQISREDKSITVANAEEVAVPVSTKLEEEAKVDA